MKLVADYDNFFFRIVDRQKLTNKKTLALSPTGG